MFGPFTTSSTPQFICKTIAPKGCGKIMHSLCRTPLWFYVLCEADVMGGGKQLGLVGGRIIAEVFIGLLQSDAMSYLKQDPGWMPTLHSAAIDTFRMTDLLNFAGMVVPL